MSANLETLGVGLAASFVWLIYKKLILCYIALRYLDYWSARLRYSGPPPPVAWSKDYFVIDVTLHVEHSSYFLI